MKAQYEKSSYCLLFINCTACEGIQPLCSCVGLCLPPVVEDVIAHCGHVNSSFMLTSVCLHRRKYTSAFKLLRWTVLSCKMSTIGVTGCTLTTWLQQRSSRCNVNTVSVYFPFIPCAFWLIQRIVELLLFDCVWSVVKVHKNIKSTSSRGLKSPNWLLLMVQNHTKHDAERFRKLLRKIDIPDNQLDHRISALIPPFL